MMPPEYDRRFYLESIESMCKRYEIMFKKNKMGWKSYYKTVIKQIGQCVYTIWIFLCGLEPVLDDCFKINEKEKRKEFLISSTKRRIWILLHERKMMSDYLKNI